jgi:hypothetical protein
MGAVMSENVIQFAKRIADNTELWIDYFRDEVVGHSIRGKYELGDTSLMEKTFADLQREVKSLRRRRSPTSIMRSVFEVGRCIGWLERERKEIASRSLLRRDGVNANKSRVVERRAQDLQEYIKAREQVLAARDGDMPAKKDLFDRLVSDQWAKNVARDPPFSSRHVAKFRKMAESLEQA